MKLNQSVAIAVISIILITLAVGCSGKAPVSPSVESSPSRQSQNPEEAAELSLSPDSITLIVLLDGAPENVYTDAINAADSAFPQIETLSDGIKEIYRSNRADIAGPSMRSRIRPLVERIFALKRERAAMVTSILRSSLDEIQTAAIDKINAIPDTAVASSDLVLNSLTVVTKREHIAEIRALTGVLEATEDFEAIPVTDTTAQSMQLRPGAYPQAVWDVGFHGEGVAVMAMDTGVYTQHEAFNGLEIKSEKFPTYASDCTPDDTSDHGTHSCGVIASQDATYRGMAWGIDTYYNAKMCNGYDGFAAVQDAYDWAALGGTGFNDAQVLNFSMVFAYACEQRDGLDMLSEYYDNTVDLYDVVWSLGAGNRDAGCENDQIDDKPAVGYNGVAVVGVTDNNTGLRDDDSYYENSKYGPCYGADGSEERLKPDIMAPTVATSPGAGGGYGEFPGTSCTAPHYSGVAAVLMSAGATSSLQVRALTFATAIDFTSSPAGPGPDYYSGFGYVNAWNAYAHIADTYTGSFSSTGDTRTFRIPVIHDGDRVVLVCNKHKSATSWKLSNLDLKAYDNSSGNLLYQTTKQYENKEYIQFGPSDAGKDVIVAVVGTEIASGISNEKWALAANTVMTEYAEPNSKAPILLAPVSGYNYTLGSNLTFNWAPASGTVPTAYWVDVWRDGVHFQLLPDGGINLGAATQLYVPFQFVETRARDGLWEWSVASVIGGQKYWSERSSILKYTAPDLISPAHNGTVQPLELFDWSDSAGALNYVARITGVKPAGEPFYLPLNKSASDFVLSQVLYDFLTEQKDYTWAIAGTALGSSLSAADQETLSRLSYSVPWTFRK